MLFFRLFSQASFAHGFNFLLFCVLDHLLTMDLLLLAPKFCDSLAEKLDVIAAFAMLLLQLGKAVFITASVRHKHPPSPCLNKKQMGKEWHDVYRAIVFVPATKFPCEIVISLGPQGSVAHIVTS